MLTIGRFNIVFGGQAGSEGKGKIACHIAHDYMKGVSVNNGHKLILACNHMPNAGHTYKNKNTNIKYVARQLPTPAILNCNSYHYGDIPVYIGPGSAINIKSLEEEVETCCLEPGKTLFIHPRAGIVTDEHLEIEGAVMDNVSSTKKGGGACIAAKVMRQARKDGNHAIARDMLPKHFMPAITDTADDLIALMGLGHTVLFEGAQGFDLDINHGLEYPFVTSRMSNVSASMAESGIPPIHAGQRIMVIRPFPIRVGNVYDKDGKMTGYSGDYSSDNEEVSFDDVKKFAGTPDDMDITERTTVTQKIRRIFTFSNERFAKSLRVNDPTQIWVTFADYLDHSIYGKSGNLVELSATTQINMKKFISNIHSGRHIVGFSTGPDNSHIVTC